MRSFAAIVWNEVLLNTKRVAPYALMILFSANAVLWWGWGPAVERGWATNSDFYIQRNMGGFSFVLGLPIFTAVIMGDPVIRDFRFGIDPLIFSKPISRLTYLLGKFFGNFFVLVCCQFTFALTTLLLQWVPFSGMVKQPVKFFPYFKHFFIIVVITHMLLAAIYFAAGTLTRNAKIVYALALCFYPALIVFQLLLKNLPEQLRVLIDPVGFNFQSKPFDPWTSSADVINQYVASYSLTAYANRVVMIIVTAACLFIVYLRFAIAERSAKVEHFSTLGLLTGDQRVYYDSDSFRERYLQREMPETYAHVILPSVTGWNQGFQANLNKLKAALSIEFRLLRAERSLIFLVPLAILLSLFDLTFYPVVPEVSYSATYASGTAKALLLFLTGMTLFYTGEAIYRDREVRIESVLWTTPGPNTVLLLSKYLATLLLALSLITLTGLTAITVQLVRGYTPIDISAYLLTYGVILLPSIIFMTGVSIALGLLLRNKYFAYVVGIGIGAGLLYFYSIGYNHWLYNPMLYGLWYYRDLTGAGPNQTIILWHRLYCVAIAVTCLALAHLFFQRKSTKRFLVNGRMSEAAWSLVIGVISIAISVIAGIVIASR